MFTSWPRCIVCIDMNAFYASIEQRMQPRLRKKPVAITNGEKGSCIITCSYEARAFGIYTGMRFQEGLRYCPKLIQCPSRPSLYADVSRKIMKTLHNITPDIEVFSVDEAFLDMTHTHHGFTTPEALAEYIKICIWQQVKLPLSIGIGTDKTIAKYAAKYKKPMGTTIVYPSQTASILGPLPVTELCGVGQGISRFLKRYGAYTCADVAKLPAHILAQRFGHLGRRIWLMCHGKDPDPVHVQSKGPKSMGHGKVLPPGSKGRIVAYKYLCSMAFKLSIRLQQHNLWAQILQVNIRYYNYKRQGSEFKLLKPSHEYTVFIELIKHAVAKIDENNCIRQVHINAPILHESIQQDLLLQQPVKTTAQKTIALINKRFGPGSIMPARLHYQSSPEVIAPAWKPDGARDYIDKE